MRRFRDESAFTLIEVLVSALIVVVGSGAVLTALGSADASSGNQRAHTVANAVAEQAIEALRSESPETLIGYVTTPPSLPPVTRNGVTYQRTVTAAWQTEQGGSATCGGPLAGAHYLLLTVTVNYADRGRARSVRFASLAAVPTTSNRAKVTVRTAGHSPFSGLSVVLRDAGGAYVDSATTSAAGCVEWEYQTPGGYTASVTRPGYVAPDGSDTASQGFTVAHSSVNDITLDYDRAATATVRFYTQWSGTQAPWCPAKPCQKIYPPAGSGIDQITVQNGEQPADRVFGTAGDEVPQITTSSATSAGLFPFATSYSIFPGLCLPSGSGVPAAIAATLATTPGSNDTIELRLPELGIHVGYKTSRRGAVSDADGARIILDRVAGYGCPAVRLPTRVTGADGLMPFPGVPSGYYTACVEYTRNGTTYYVPSGLLDVRDFNAPGAWNVTVGAYSGSGQSAVGNCP